MIRWILPLAVLAGGCAGDVIAGESPPVLDEPVAEEEPVEWTLAVGGDIMLNGIAPSSGPLEGVRELFVQADLSFANLEIPLTDARTPTDRKTAEEVRSRRQYILKADPRHADDLSIFSFLSLGNNHTMDYGVEGLRQTVELLAAARLTPPPDPLPSSRSSNQGGGVLHAGAGMNRKEAERPAVVEVGGLRVGMISYLAFVTSEARWKCWPATDDGPGVAGLELGGVVNRERIRLIVERAREECDFLIVSLHWGWERETEPTAFQVSVGRAFIEEGADVVLGHHPHVLQGMEVHERKPIFYSLGNLISATPAETAVFVLRFRGTEYLDYEMYPARISGGKVRLMAERERETALRRFEELNAKVNQ